MIDLVTREGTKITLAQAKNWGRTILYEKEMTVGDAVTLAAELSNMAAEAYRRGYDAGWKGRETFEVKVKRACCVGIYSLDVASSPGAKP